MTLAVNGREIAGCEAARRVAAVCRLPEAEEVQERVRASVERSSRADVLWLTWVQWRALGREAMIHETGLSLWTITTRLRQLRAAGAPVCPGRKKPICLARGQFHEAWA